MVERWSAEILALYAAKPKHQLLFGQKLALVRKIAAENVAGRGTPKFKKPQRVLDLLERLEPFAALRCSLAHAVQTVRIRSDGQAVFLYQSIGRPPSLAVALTEAAQRNMLSQLTRIAKQITDQRARPA